MNTTILIAEDNPDDVTLIRRAFVKAALPSSLQIVRDGDSAIAYLSGTDGFEDREAFPFPALLLLDLKLPRRSGFDILTWIRSHQHLRRLPIVVLTSSREGGDINRAYELGANSYLMKPVKFEHLLEMVKTVNQYWIGMNEKPVF